MKPGTRVDQFEIIALLGAGGMGEVFRGRDTRLNREVAIKVLPKDFAVDVDRLRRFEQEAKTLAALNHPNIMTVFDAGQHEDAPYLVSELLEGRTLREELAAGALSGRKATDYALQMAQGLAAAHGRGVVHRDLKPDNVFITRDGRVKILDFGLAKLREVPGSGIRTAGPSDPDAPTLVQRPAAETTEPGRVMGTPSYMAPEQVRGEALDHRADLFAFGCVLYEMVSGQRPFRRDTSIATMAAIMNDEPADLASARPDLAPALARIVHRCLEKAPDNRFQSARDLAFALSELAAGSSANRSPAGGPVAARPLRKTWAWPAIAALLSVLLVVLTGAWWRTARTPGRAGQIRSLAVLPFRVDTQDQKLAELGKWIPADIRSKLGPLQNLEVVNLPSRIEQLVQQKKSEVEIARELGVDGLVVGELHGQGETMSAYVSVVDGATGRALGRQREIASSAAKVSELPNQVALAIADELKLQLSASQRAEIQVADTQNAEAFLAYQKGKNLLSRRLHAEAAVEFRRALQLDANYTQARTLLANSEWIPLIFGGTTNEMAATFKRLSGEAERFRAQRPDDPAVAGLRMWIAMLYERDWNKVRTIFWESERSSKPDTWVMNAMSWYYTLIEGHPELALNAREQTIALDPENVLWKVDRAGQLGQFGRFDDAVRAYRSLPAEKIQLEDYSTTLLKLGDLTGAKEMATRVLAGRPNALTQCNLAAIHAKSGAPDEARKILRELEAQAEKGMHIPYAWIARSYGMLGDFEAARRWLRQGLLEGHGDWTMVELRAAVHLEMFGKLGWYWEIVDEMKFPPLQMDHPYFALEQQMRYHRGVGGELIPTASTNEPPRTLAVLPFDELGAGTADDDFNEGLTIELITKLQNVRGLQVQGPMSSMRFKGAVDGKQVGEQLKVDHLLKGNVRRSGDRLRIDVSLQKAADGFGLWATNYDRKQSDIFAIQAEVAQEVAEALKVRLGVEDRRSLARQPTDNTEAYALYLQGRAAWNRRTIPEFMRATNFFGQALAKDTNFARAYAGMADVHALWPIYTGEPPGVHSAETIRFARLALEKDPRLAEPHAALAFSLFAHHCDWEGAEREFQAAIRLDPESATAHHWYAELLYIMGRPDEALKEAQRSVELDPTSQNKDTFGTAMARAGQVDRAVAYFEELTAAEPSFPNHNVWFFWVLAQRGDFEGASKAMARTEHYFGQGNGLWKAWLLALQGKAREARELLAREQESSRTNVVRALVLHALGEDREALDVLERAVQQRELLIDLTYHLPLWSKLHGDPRFMAVLRSIHLEKHVPVPASTHAK